MAVQCCHFSRKAGSTAGEPCRGSTVAVPSRAGTAVEGGDPVPGICSVGVPVLLVGGHFGSDRVQTQSLTAPAGPAGGHFAPPSRSPVGGASCREPGPHQGDNSRTSSAGVWKRWLLSFAINFWTIATISGGTSGRRACTGSGCSI